MQWEVCDTLVNIAVARSRRIPTKVRHIYLYQSPNGITSKIENQLSIKDDNQDDVQRNNYYVDYNINHFEEDEKTESLRVGKSELTEGNKPVNIGVNRWLKNRNWERPITFGDLLEVDGIDSEDERSETPLIAIEDYCWFEPTLKKIELKYEKRKDQLLSSLSLDRKCSSSTVPLRANKILKNILEDEMHFEIKRKYKEMKVEGLKTLDEQTEDSNLFEKDSSKETDVREKTDLLKEMNSKTKGSNNVEDYEKQIEKNIWSIKRNIETNRSEGRFWPDGHENWKKVQEIRAFVENESLHGVVDEEEVERIYLEWKKFMLTQDFAMEKIRKNKDMFGMTVEKNMLELTLHKKKHEMRNIEDINRSSYKVSEQQREKRDNSNETQGTKNTIFYPEESPEAVDYSDIQLNEEKNHPKVLDDTLVDFTDIFPSQAGKPREIQRLKNEDYQYVRSLGHEKKISREKEFAEIEQLFRNDMIAAPKRTKKDTNAMTLHSLSTISIADDNDIVSNDFWLDKDEGILKNKTNSVLISTCEKKRAEQLNNPSDTGNCLMDNNEEKEQLRRNGSDTSILSEERKMSLPTASEEQESQKFYRGMIKDYDHSHRLKENLIQKDVDVIIDSFISPIDERQEVFQFTEHSRNEMEEICLTVEDTTTPILDEKSKRIANEELGVLKLHKDNVKEDHLLNEMKDDKVLNQMSTKVDKKSDYIANSDINLPPEQRSTTLLGTFQEQHMSNMYLQSNIRTKDGKKKFDQQYNNFFCEQEKRIESLEEIDDENHNLEEMLKKDGDIDFEKVLSMIDQKLEIKKSLKESSTSTDNDYDLEQEKKKELTVHKREQKDVTSDSINVINSRNNTSFLTSKNIKNDSDPRGVLITPEVASDIHNIKDVVTFESSSKSPEIRSSSNGNIAKSIKYKEVFGGKPSFIIDSKGSMENRNDLEYELFAGDHSLTEEMKKSSNLIKEVEVSIQQSEVHSIFTECRKEYDLDDYRAKDKMPVRNENADLSMYLERKKMLLDLKVFSKHEIEMVMELKDRIQLEDFTPDIAQITKPFKEFGAIFRLEGVLVDISTLQARAWQRVIEKLNLEKPSDKSIHLASVHTPEYAARKIFFWTNNHKKCTEIGWAYNQFLMEELNCALENLDSELSHSSETHSMLKENSDITLVEGVKSWIKAITDVEMPIMLVSYLEKEAVDIILNATGLADFFPDHKRVTKESGCDKDSYLQLSACLHVDRNPGACVLFEANIEGLSVARENDIRSVGVMTVYPCYDLQSADTTIRDFNYMTAMNLRSLFGERKDLEPETLPDTPISKNHERKVITFYPDNEISNRYVNNDGKGKKINQYNGFYSDDAKYDNGIDQDRYYGEDNYSPPRYNNIHEDGLLYTEESEESLFQ